MTGESCREWRGQLAAWVLGQLDGDEAEDLVDHLTACPSCEGTAGDLSGVAAALRMASPHGPPALARQPPARLGDAVVARVAAERSSSRRRLRLRGAAVVAAVAVVVAASAVAVWPGDDGRLPVEVVEVAQGLGAEVEVRDWGWGASLYLTADGLEQGAVYHVWVEDDEGERQPAGSFIGVADREITCYMAAATRLDDAALVGIDGPDGATVLRGRVPAASS